MKFTIQLVAKNEEQYIGRAISSVLIQDVDFELIMNISSESTDGTLKIVEAYKSFLGDKMIIYKRPADQCLHDSAQACLDMARGDIWHATSAHTHYLEGALKYVQENIANSLFGAVLHEDNIVQLPTSAENMSGYSMFISIPFMREHKLGYDPKYPNLADYFLRKRIWSMGEAKRTNKVTTMCSPRAFTRAYSGFAENNRGSRAVEWQEFRTNETLIEGSQKFSDACDAAFPIVYPK